MQTSPRMQAFLTQLIEKHKDDFTSNLNGQHQDLVLELDSYPALCLMVGDNWVNVSQEVLPEEREEIGFTYDPEILFRAGGEAQPLSESVWELVSIFHIAESARMEGTEFVFDAEADEAQTQREVHFCESLALELKEQGWLERAHARPTHARPL